MKWTQFRILVVFFSLFFAVQSIDIIFFNVNWNSIRIRNMNSVDRIVLNKALICFRIVFEFSNETIVSS